jgi:uncharacterized protein (TIGR02246 family)
MSDEVKVIQNAIDEWVDAANANDPDRICRLVTDRFEMIPPGEPPAAGSQGQEFLRGFFQRFILRVKSTTIELVVSGDWAFRRYTYELTLTPKAGGEAAREEGHGMHLLQRQGDGSWKFAKDIWTSVP